MEIPSLSLLFAYEYYIWPAIAPYTVHNSFVSYFIGDPLELHLLIVAGPQFGRRKMDHFRDNAGNTHTHTHTGRILTYRPDTCVQMYRVDGGTLRILLFQTSARSMMEGSGCETDQGGGYKKLPDLNLCLDSRFRLPFSIVLGSRTR